MTPAQKYAGGDFRSYEDPITAELQQFPAACAEAAAAMYVGGSQEFIGAVRRAAAFCTDIAINHLAHPTGRVNLESLGISQQMLLNTITPIVFVAPDGVETAAAQFCARYGWLVELIAEAIANFETGTGAREVVLT